LRVSLVLRLGSLCPQSSVWSLFGPLSVYCLKLLFCILNFNALSLFNLRIFLLFDTVLWCQTSSSFNPFCALNRILQINDWIIFQYALRISLFTVFFSWCKIWDVQSSLDLDVWVGMTVFTWFWLHNTNRLIRFCVIMTILKIECRTAHKTSNLGVTLWSVVFYFYFLFHLSCTLWLLKVDWL